MNAIQQINFPRIARWTFAEPIDPTNDDGILEALREFVPEIRVRKWSETVQELDRFHCKQHAEIQFPAGNKPVLIRFERDEKTNWPFRFNVRIDGVDLRVTCTPSEADPWFCAGAVEWHYAVEFAQ